MKVDEQIKGSPTDLSFIKTPTSGAYTILSIDNVFYTVQGKTIFAYSDDASTASSKIKLRNSLVLPLAEDDAIAALNMTYNGFLVFATKKGVVGVVDRGLATTPKTVTLTDADLGATTTNISNSISTNADGGIFVVSSRSMNRVHWDGTNLHYKNGHPDTWSVAYEFDASICVTGNGGRLGEGSGTTPTVMGGQGDEQLVVINDCAKKNNLALFWANRIPTGWKGTKVTKIVNGQSITETKDLRFAAQVPVDFGDNRESIYSEQSPLAYGNGILVVSNDYKSYGVMKTLADAAVGLLPGFKDIIASAQNLGTQIISGRPAFQPWGVAKYEWDSVNRTLNRKWYTTKVSCPSSIPSLSVPSNTAYCVGAYNGQWTVEGLDWTTGAHKFRKNIGSSVTLPLGENAKYNNFYSSTELAHDGGMIYGSLSGVVYLPPVK